MSVISSKDFCRSLCDRRSLCSDRGSRDISRKKCNRGHVAWERVCRAGDKTPTTPKPALLVGNGGLYKPTACRTSEIGYRRRCICPAVRWLRGCHPVPTISGHGMWHRADGSRRLAARQPPAISVAEKQRKKQGLHECLRHPCFFPVSPLCVGAPQPRCPRALPLPPHTPRGTEGQPLVVCCSYFLRLPLVGRVGRPVG